MSTKLSVGDLIITNTYEGKVHEVCQYEGQTGSLMYRIESGSLSQLERFIKHTESLPYSSRIVRKGSPEWKTYAEGSK